MKKLLIFTITLFAFGCNEQQSRIVFKEVPPSRQNANMIFVVDSNGTPFYNKRAFAYTFAILYLEYAKECYDDSTLVEWSGSPTPNPTPVEIDSAGNKHLRYPSYVVTPAVLVHHREWQHKEPTLHGFVEYLERKK